ncbi:MAG TPA: cation diffusion facilitator family transporter [Dehalococcoidia bacterium]|nr:cation diffusion facilitator family transporter [Dehalococcoidia bacterium]
MTAVLRSLVPRDLPSRAAALSFASNLVLMVLKVTVGLLSGSVAVLSDGLDSAQDCVAAGIAFVSVSIGRRPPDLEHPYGHGRAETIAATLQALMIAGGGLYIIYRSVDRFVDPPRDIGTTSGFAVMLLAAGVNLGVAHYSRRVADLTGSPAIASDARHLLTNVVQAVGVLLGLLLVAATGEVRFDAAVAFCLGVYLLWIAGSIAWTSLADVLDSSLRADEIALIEQSIVAEGEQIEGFHRLRTRRSGQSRYVDLHLILNPELTVAEAHDITERIEARIHTRWPNAAVTIHTEPADGRFLGPMQESGNHGREGEHRSDPRGS